MGSNQIYITPFTRIAPSEFIDETAPALLDAEKLFCSQNAELHSSGRSALFAARNFLGQGDKPRLFVPRCFCPKICRKLRNIYELKFFDDFPSEEFPRFDTLACVKSGDAILAVNFFGLRRKSAWEKWDKFAQENEGVKIIEDHSHAPFCGRMKATPSDFAFASFRKTLPLPDGGVLKISERAGKARGIFKKPASDMHPFAADSLAGECVARSSSLRSEAENLFYSGEGKLNAENLPSRMSAYSFDIFPRLLLDKMSHAKFENLKIFRALTKDAFEKCGVREINFDFEPPATPNDFFFPVLRFPNTELRNKCYAYLAERGAFCSIYWGALLKEQATPETLAEISKTFVAPLDFSHSKREAEIFAELVCASLK